MKDLREPWLERLGFRATKELPCGVSQEPRQFDSHAGGKEIVHSNEPALAVEKCKADRRMRQHGIQQRQCVIQAGALLLHGQHQKIEGLGQLSGFIRLRHLQRKAFLGLRIANEPSCRVHHNTQRPGNGAGKQRRGQHAAQYAQNPGDQRDPHQRVHFFLLGSRVLRYPRIPDQMSALTNRTDSLAIPLVVQEDVSTLQRPA